MLSIQAATDDDLAIMSDIDFSYVTTVVWQMDHHTDGEEMLTRFRVVRLPHPLRLNVAAQPASEGVEATSRVPGQQVDLFLVAYDDSELVGYLRATADVRSPIAWLSQIGVREQRRRQGVGTALISEVKLWGQGQGLSAIMAGVNTQNYPATRFLQRYGFVFCGYNDRSYPGPDIAILFCYELK